MVKPKLTMDHIKAYLLKVLAGGSQMRKGLGKRSRAGPGSMKKAAKVVNPIGMVRVWLSSPSPIAANAWRPLGD